MAAPGTRQPAITPVGDSLEPLNRKWSDGEARVSASELLTVVVFEPTDIIHLQENRHADF